MKGKQTYTEIIRTNLKITSGSQKTLSKQHREYQPKVGIEDKKLLNRTLQLPPCNLNDFRCDSTKIGPFAYKWDAPENYMSTEIKKSNCTEKQSVLCSQWNPSRNQVKITHKILAATNGQKSTILPSIHSMLQPSKLDPVWKQQEKLTYLSHTSYNIEKSISLET